MFSFKRIKSSIIIISILMFSLVAWSSDSVEITTEDFVTPTMFGKTIAKKVSIDDAVEKYIDDVGGFENVLFVEQVSIDFNALINDTFVMNLGTNESIEISNPTVNTMGGVRKLKWTDIEQDAALSLVITDNQVKGQLHVGLDIYTIRPLENGDHVIFLTTRPQDAIDIQADEPGAIEEKKSIWGNWGRADFDGDGYDDICKLTWVDNGLTLKVQTDLDGDGDFDTQRYFKSTIKGFSTYSYFTMEFGDWDGDGKDGLLMGFHSKSSNLTLIEFWRDYVPSSPSSTSRRYRSFDRWTNGKHWSQILAGAWGANESPCDYSGDNIALVHNMPQYNQMRIYHSCKNVQDIPPNFPSSALHTFTKPLRAHAANLDNSGETEHVIDDTYPAYNRYYRIPNFTGNYNIYRFAGNAEAILWGHWRGSSGAQDRPAFRIGNTWHFNLNGYADVDKTTSY